MTNILLTGSTGFVGQGLLHFFTHKKFDGTMHLAIRDKKGDSAIKRFEKIKRDFPLLKMELCVIPIVDLHDKIIPEINCIINCAAAIDFNLEIRDALHQNVDGLKSLIQFANKNANVNKFIHVSTTYVSDSSSPIIREEFVNLDIINPNAEIIYQQVKSGQLTFEEIVKKHFFPNTYCATKCIAEKIIEQEIVSQTKVDYSIVRPSIITSALTIPYNGWFQGYAAGLGIFTLFLEQYMPYIRLSNNCCPNLVPIDFVCNTIYNSMFQTKLAIQHSVIENSVKNVEIGYLIIYDIFAINVFVVSFLSLVTRFYHFIRMFKLNIQYYLCFNQKTRSQISVLYKILQNIDTTFYTFQTNTYNFEVKKKYDFDRPFYVNNPFKYLKNIFDSIVFKRQLFHLQDPTKQSYFRVIYNIWFKYFSFDFANNVKYGILLIYALFTKFILLKLYKNIVVEIEDYHSCTFQTKPILVLSNHNSHLDTAILKYLFLVHHNLRLYNPVVIATDDFKKVDNPLIQQVLKNTNIKYISRDNFDKEEFIHFLKTEIKSNTNIMLFPEGTRSRDKTISKFKSGIYDLMKQHIDFKVLPISIAYSNVPETNGFVTSLCNLTNQKKTSLFGNIGLTTLFKLLFNPSPTDFCCVKLDQVIQSPDTIQDVETIILQNHHYLQNKYYKHLNLDCKDRVRCCLNHLQYSKFDTIIHGLDKIEYDTDYNPLFPVSVDYNRVFYPLYKDLLIENYKLDLPKQMGEFSKQFLHTLLPTFEPKYILLTGATGLIGSNLLDSLIQTNKCEEFIIISRNIQKNNVIKIGNCSFHLLKGDITNIDAIDDYDFKLWNLKEIYHFAGQVTHHKNTKLIHDMIAANTKGTHNICKMIEINQTIHKGVMNVTYMSTSGVALKEAEQFPYYKSKILAEEYIRNHSIANEYNLTIFRPSMVIGDVKMEILEKLGINISQPKENFFNKVKNGHMKFCTNTNVNAISIDELISCIIKAKYNAIQIYNCSGLNYELIDIFKHYNQTKYIYVNDFFMKLLFFITNIVNVMPSLHYYMRMSKYDWTIDTTLTKKKLGFNPISLFEK